MLSSPFSGQCVELAVGSTPLPKPRKAQQRRIKQSHANIHAQNTCRGPMGMWLEQARVSNGGFLPLLPPRLELETSSSKGLFVLSTERIACGPPMTLLVVSVRWWMAVGIVKI